MPIAAHRALRTTARGLIAALLLLAFGRAGQSEAQALIKVNDNINFKVGMLMQPQMDFQEVRNLTDDGGAGYQQNIFIRRLRLLIGGQVAKDVFFFAETENGSLGKSTQAVGGAQAAKSLGTGFNLLDAVGEWRIAKEFNIQVGEIRVPISREALKGSTSNFMLDFSSYAFPTSAALQNNSERDTGVMLRGYFNCDRLEYRAGVFSGFRAPGVKNAPRFTGRLQYNFFDTEVYSFVSLPGGYYGSKKILAIGGAYDTQNDFRYASADLYLDWPIPLGSFQSSIQYQYINGGNTFAAALPQQNTFQIEGGVFLKGLGIGPSARYEQKAFTAPIVNNVTTKDENRVAVGLNFYPFPKTPNAFNVKFWWQRVQLKPGAAPNQTKAGYPTNQFTVQMQIYYF
ncbi:MAG TPA: porin [Thermoanaerobaculia bacterium]